MFPLSLVLELIRKNEPDHKTWQNGYEVNHGQLSKFTYLLAIPFLKWMLAIPFLKWILAIPFLKWILRK